MKVELLDIIKYISQKEVEENSELKKAFIKVYDFLDALSSEDFKELVYEALPRGIKG